MKKRIIVVIILYLSISIFIGIMIASAGVAMSPKLANISAWLVCGKSEYVIEKSHYSYKPGQSGYELFFYCSEGKRKEDRLNVIHVLGVTAAMYSAIVLGILLILSPLFLPKFFRFRDEIRRLSGKGKE